MGVEQPIDDLALPRPQLQPFPARLPVGVVMNRSIGARRHKPCQPSAASTDPGAAVTSPSAQPSPYAARMQFIVITAEGTETYYGSYEVEDRRGAEIRPKDRSELISLSPAFWRQINEPRSSYDMLDSANEAES